MKQEIFKFGIKDAFLKEDFFISNSNEAALKIVENFINWNFFAYNIYGEKNSGKTHLANIFANQYLCPIISAQNINMSNIFDIFEQSKLLVIEDIDTNINQEAMFHLYNMYKNEGGFILFTSSKPLAQFDFSIKDLESRFSAVPTVEILSPDDELLTALIVKLFDDRQISISPEILKYIITHSVRSFSYIKNLVKELDELSLERKKPINIAMIKEIISFLEDNLQPPLF